MTPDLLHPSLEQPDVDPRPLLLAMNNPQSPRPEHALYPHPEGCAGHRLWTMLHEAGVRAGIAISKLDYLTRFDRRNLVSASVWSAADARRAAGGVLDAAGGRTLAVLGAATLKALQLPRRPWGVLSYSASSARPNDLFTYVLLPHPSGRCREYNDEAMRRLAGDVLLRMYLDGATFRSAPAEAIVSGL